MKLLSLTECFNNILTILNSTFTDKNLQCFLYLTTRKIRNEYILVNINNIPEHLNKNDILNILNGKLINV